MNLKRDKKLRDIRESIKKEQDLIAQQGWTFSKERAVRRIGSNEIRVLELIILHDDHGVNRGQISSTLGLDTGNLSRYLDKLKELRLVVEVDKNFHVLKERGMY